MKKIILLLLITQSVFAQKLSKEQLITKISEGTCECITKKEITKENLELTLGLCMLEDFNKYEKDIEKYYGKNVISDDSKMEALGRDVGVQMATKCPSFLKLIMDSVGDDDGDDEEIEAVEEIEPSVVGKYFQAKSEQFVTFSIKEASGKTVEFILLNNFDNSFLLTENILKSNDEIEVFYYELEMFDAKIKKFVTYKIVSDIIKK
ncbi:hypothetical protein [Flavobacterium sp. N2270]|uniref:hypothetical protein n=1 Tax=Flavobacterium sp. N2270 TaxID=2986831 RepID=UPI002224C674|nr:hypothetical protein [Flavobacterium sp. N2270]